MERHHIYNVLCLMRLHCADKGIHRLRRLRLDLGIHQLAARTRQLQLFIQGRHSHEREALRVSLVGIIGFKLLQ
ncbi:hypothetical protein D3C73_706300 [compost metagenome]